VTGVEEFFADLDDAILQHVAHRRGRRVRSTRAKGQTGVALLAVRRQQLVDPTSVQTVVSRQRGDRTALLEMSLHQVAPDVHRKTP